MFRKVAQGFTNAATKPGCLGPFQRSLPQQESALSNAYESNDRNVTGLSYKKNTTKVQQLEIFPTQYIGVSKFLLGRIPASGSGKPSLEGDVQFKKLRDIARLNPALCHSESQPVGFGANQQAVKNILAEREKSDILSGTWGLMQNPISHSFREGEMYTNKQHVENSQEEQLQDKKKLKSQIKEPNDQATKPTEEKNQLDKDLNITKQSLNEKDGKLESKDEELKNETQQLKALKSENKELKTKLQKSEKKNKELNEELDRRISKVNTLTEGKEQLEKNLNSTKQSLNEKDKELKSENEKLKGQNQRLEELKSTNEGKIQQLESRIKELEALKSENESQIKGLQKELEDNKDSKPSAVNAKEVKSKANYTSASFMLSWVCAVGASLATPYLAICATLAVAASVFLALGCYYSYKTNTALSNVEVVDRLGKQPLLVE